MDNKPTNILVVEDSKTFRYIISKILTEEGYEVFMAENGRMGIDLFADHPNIGLIVSDVDMPVMNGLEMIKELHQLMVDAPVIMLSGHSDIHMAISALQNGAEDYLLKDNNLKKSLPLAVKKALDSRKLREQNHQLMADLTMKHEELKSANRKITDSIEYAERIQRSLLPNFTEIKSYLSENFIIWKPRDIVSGDMIFTENFQDGCLVVIMDCTGHGVPGAFMTMIATSCLRTVVIGEGGKVDPSLILKRLNIMVKSILGQDSGDAPSDDGLDAAACFVNKKERIVRYAGARLPIFYTANGEIKSIRGDKQSIGYKKSDPAFEFKTHSIKIDNEMTIYLTSDGLFDQLGGAKRFPFGKRRLQDILGQNKARPLPEQGDLLLRAFEEYTGGEVIQDDVTMIGFKA